MPGIQSLDLRAFSNSRNDLLLGGLLGSPFMGLDVSLVCSFLFNVRGTEYGKPHTPRTLHRTICFHRHFKDRTTDTGESGRSANLELGIALKFFDMGDQFPDG